MCGLLPNKPWTGISRWPGDAGPLLYGVKTEQADTQVLSQRDF